jgi:hypothetical protein
MALELVTKVAGAGSPGRLPIGFPGRGSLLVTLKGVPHRAAQSEHW